MAVDYLRSVDPERAFTLKNGSGEVVDEIMDLEGLRNALSSAPGDAILFHMDNRNDFAAWVGDVISCGSLSRALQDIPVSPKNVEKTRKDLLSSMDLAIGLLKEANGKKRKARKSSPK